MVINNEPGGHVFAMQGGTENDEGTFMSVTIPAVMVSAVLYGEAAFCVMGGVSIPYCL